MEVIVVKEKADDVQLLAKIYQVTTIRFGSTMSIIDVDFRSFKSSDVFRYISLSNHYKYTIKRNPKSKNSIIITIL